MPTGLTANPASPTWARYFGGTMPTVPQCPGLMRTGSKGNGVFVMTFTVSGSTTSTRSIVAMLVRPGAACWGFEHPLDAELDGGGVEGLAVVELHVRGGA